MRADVGHHLRIDASGLPDQGVGELERSLVPRRQPAAPEVVDLVVQFLAAAGHHRGPIAQRLAQTTIVLPGLIEAHHLGGHRVQFTYPCDLDEGALDQRPRFAGGVPLDGDRPPRFGRREQRVEAGPRPRHPVGDVQQLDESAGVRTDRGGQRGTLGIVDHRHVHRELLGELQRGTGEVVGDPCGRRQRRK
ncbi:hypothetical protein GS931_05980 [Rhodococcus hoagii]|nr:hypothetical protein [Prescottella equi]